MLSRLVVILVLTSFLFVPAPAQADSLLNYIFPSIFGRPYLGPDPAKSGLAPFAPIDKATKGLTDAERAALKSPENSVPITQAHRAEPYVAKWVAETVAAALTIDPQRINAHNQVLSENFTDQGVGEFGAWYASGNLATLVSSGNTIQSYSPALPTILNAGEFGGAYRWLYDVPVTISVMPSGLNSYAEINPSKVNTITSTFRVQIGRTVGNVFKDGMAIERFTLAPNP